MVKEVIPDKPVTGRTGVAEGVVVQVGWKVGRGVEV